MLSHSPQADRPGASSSHYFRTLRKDGTWQRANCALYVALPHAQGRQVSPNAAIIDNRSVKTAEKGSP